MGSSTPRAYGLHILVRGAPVGPCLSLGAGGTLPEWAVSVQEPRASPVHVAPSLLLSPQLLEVHADFSLAPEGPCVHTFRDHLACPLWQVNALVTQDLAHVLAPPLSAQHPGLEHSGTLPQQEHGSTCWRVFWSSWLRKAYIRGSTMALQMMRARKRLKFLKTQWQVGC